MARLPAVALELRIRANTLEDISSRALDSSPVDHQYKPAPINATGNTTASTRDNDNFGLGSVMAGSS
jgi:hypothetical protein